MPLPVSNFRKVEAAEFAEFEENNGRKLWKLMIVVAKRDKFLKWTWNIQKIYMIYIGNDFPLFLIIEVQIPKLMATLHDKKNYWVLYRYLK